MIIVDANVLVYAYTASHAQQHERARTLEEQLATAARVALPWSSLLAFVRLVTNARLFTEPVSMSTAWLRCSRGSTQRRRGSPCRPRAIARSSAPA